MRNASSEKMITNLCDEFLHIDSTPEADICEHCVACKCVRKSVTCLVCVRENDQEVYTNIYKNQGFKDYASAVHAEAFFINDAYLRTILRNNQVITLYLTYQPCHYSGGHFRAKQISCTVSLIHFYEKHLKPLNIELHIKFAYIYRAHWCMNDKYKSMIQNSIDGLKLLSQYAKLSVLKENDLCFIRKFCSPDIICKLDNGYFDEILFKRKKIEAFMTVFLENLGVII